MAVNSAPFGLQLYQAGGDPEELIECYASASVVLGLGDAVVLEGSYEGAGSPNPLRPTITRAAATGGIFGVVVGIQQHRVEGSGQNLSRRHKPSDVAMYVSVRRARLEDIYKIRCDAAVAVTQVGNVGLLATIADANTTTGMSKMELSGSSLTTAQTAYQLLLRGFPEAADSIVNTINQEVLVSINNIQGFHAFGGV